MPNDGLTDQPSKAPTRKVKATGLGGAVAVVAVALLGAVGVELPGVDFDTLPTTEALGVMVALGFGYFARERS